MTWRLWAPSSWPRPGPGCFRFLVRLGRNKQFCIEADADFAPKQFQQHRHPLIAGHTFIKAQALLESAVAPAASPRLQSAPGDENGNQQLSRD